MEIHCFRCCLRGHNWQLFWLSFSAEGMAPCLQHPGLKGGHPRYGVFDFAVNVFHHVPCGCSDVCDSHLDFILNVDSFNMTTFLKHMSTNPREFILAEKNMLAAP